MAGGLKQGSQDWDKIHNSFVTKVWDVDQFLAETIRTSRPEWSELYSKAAFATSLHA
jgi:hypothetical protein